MEVLSMSIISIPKILKEKLGEEATEALVEVMNRNGEENKQSVIDIATQRYEASLAREIGGLRSEMYDGFGTLRGEIHEGLAGLRTEMYQGFGAIRSEMHDEIGGLRTEMDEKIGGLRGEMHEGLAGLRSEMYEGFAGLHSEIAETKIHFENRLTNEISSVRTDMAKNQSNTIRWMFIFWVGQIGALIGILSIPL
jgi:hypothetical protein